MLDWLLETWPGVGFAILTIVLILWVGEKVRGPDGREDIEQM